jgi:uncharacterized membrane protein YhaH (DUF805 family)
VESNVQQDQRIRLAFWIAGGLVAIGAVAPLVVGGGLHSRIAGVFIPFAIAAAALVINGFMYQQGRPLAATLYFIAGLAIVYGILAMLAVPLRLAVVGTCPPAPTHCPIGFEQPMTSGENNGLGVATFCGVLAILTGFYGLLLFYRRLTIVARRQPSLWPAQPPVQSTAAPPAPAPPVEPPPVAPSPATISEPVPVTPAEPAPPPPTPDPTPSPKPARRAPAKKASTSTAPPAAEEPKELPAPEEPKELPPPA